MPCIIGQLLRGDGATVAQPINTQAEPGRQGAPRPPRRDQRPTAGLPRRRNTSLSTGAAESFKRAAIAAFRRENGGERGLCRLAHVHHAPLAKPVPGVV